jgi:hypothetical protein
MANEATKKQLKDFFQGAIDNFMESKNKNIIKKDPKRVVRVSKKFGL